jgi:hypothetical protein
MEGKELNSPICKHTGLTAWSPAKVSRSPHHYGGAPNAFCDYLAKAFHPILLIFHTLAADLVLNAPVKT